MSIQARRAKRGFTLVELLVVIAIIAIISAAVFALLGGLTTQSAVAMTYATEKQLTNDFNIYSKAHNGSLPDGMDSLMRDDWATTGSTATFATYVPAAGYVSSGYEFVSPASAANKFMYTGVDLDVNLIPDANVKSKGVTILACGTGVASVTVTKLRASDVTALNQMGITYVWDIDHTKDKDPNTGRLTYVKRILKVGDPVMALDSNKRFGTVPTYDTINSFAKVLPLYLVFGIGPNSTMIGDRRGGLQEPPICPTIVTSTTDKPKPRTDYYNYYMAVIKMPNDANDRPSFAGILDSQGWNTQAGQQWYARFPE